MISLNDAQLKTVMTAASSVPHEKPSQFLERIAANRPQHARRGSDSRGPTRSLWQQSPDLKGASNDDERTNETKYCSNNSPLLNYN